MLVDSIIEALEAEVETVKAERDNPPIDWDMTQDCYDGMVAGLTAAIDIVGRFDDRETIVSMEG